MLQHGVCCRCALCTRLQIWPNLDILSSSRACRGIDVWISNAGSVVYGPLVDSDDGDLSQTVNTVSRLHQ